jgi:hypothetical protein
MSEPAPAAVAAAEERLARTDPGYLDRVRRAASELAVTDPDADDARAAMDAVDHFADLDVDVPTASRFPLVGWMKWAIKRLIGWYLGYFGRQLTTFALAVTNLADILVERDEERSRDLAHLTERIERLERAGQRSA